VAQLSLLGVPNRLGGFLFGSVRGLAVVVIILVLLTPFQNTTFPPNGQPGKPGAAQSPKKAFADSMLLPYFEPLFNAIGRPLPTSNTVFNQSTGKTFDIYSTKY
jgi:uncharacterized membrane protein required for colicin V production